MKTLFLALTLLTQALPALAGDAAAFRSLGFSADGRTYAFLQFGTQDGSGFPYADVDVIDVAQNRQLRARRVVLEKDGATERQAINQALATARLGDFGIEPGRNPGRTIVLHSRDDSGTYDNVQFSLHDALPPFFELRLTTKKLEDHSENMWCTEENGPLGLRLALRNLSEENAPELVLQEDARLPRSRGCVLGYSIAQVITYGEKLVVLTKFSSVGFEGPDSRYLAVTGTVKASAAR